MIFSFSSLINMTISGSFLVGIIYFLLRNNQMLARFGTSLILGCSLIVMIRFLLPFEFSFTNSVYITDIWPAVYLFLTTDLVTRTGFLISPCDILVFIWIIGSIFLFCRSIITYFTLIKKLSNYQDVKDPTILSLVSDISSSYKHKKSFRIVETDIFITPMIFGIIKPIIILPTIPLAKGEWNYILRHEISHYYNRHLSYKLICELLCDLYWWNPFVYLFKNLFNKLLEMNVDIKVTNILSEQESLGYLNCLLKLAKMNVNCTNSTHCSIMFNNQKPIHISQRTHVVLATMEDTTKKLLFPMSGIFIAFALFLWSSLFIIIEPYDIAPTDEIGTYSFTDNSCYFIKNANGTYDFYMNSKYYKTFDSTFNDPNIKIYNSVKELPINEND